MDIALFWRGLMIGVSIAVPVGPIGILCIRRSLTQGWLTGLLTGLGAATADALYGCIAGFGLTWVSTFLVRQSWGLQIGGGLFLCYLGVKTITAPITAASPPDSSPTSNLSNSAPQIPPQLPRKGKSGLGAYGSAVLLTLTNPMTILSFAAVFAGLGLANADGSYRNAGLLVLGVFSGSALWWLTLSSGVGLLRSRCHPQCQPQHLKGFNRISGLILIVFGIIALSPVT